MARIRASFGSLDLAGPAVLEVPSLAFRVEFSSPWRPARSSQASIFPPLRPRSARVHEQSGTSCSVVEPPATADAMSAPRTAASSPLRLPRWSMHLAVLCTAREIRSIISSTRTATSAPAGSGQDSCIRTFANRWRQRPWRRRLAAVAASGAAQGRLAAVEWKRQEGLAARTRRRGGAGAVRRQELAPARTIDSQRLERLSLRSHAFGLNFFTPQPSAYLHRHVCVCDGWLVALPAFGTAALVGGVDVSDAR